MSSISINYKLEYTAEDLEVIERMGATGFTIAQIAEVLLVDPQMLEHQFQNKKSIVYKMYRKGFLQESLKLRERIFKDAGNGSSPAQTLAKKILDDAAFKMDTE